MKRVITKCLVGIAFATTILTISAPAAPMKIDPQCQSFKQKIDCTCALRHGGYIFKGRWFNRRHRNQIINEDFQKCKMEGHGWRYPT